MSNTFETDHLSFKTKCFPDLSKPFQPLPFVSQVSHIIHSTFINKEKKCRSGRYCLLGPWQTRDKILLPIDNKKKWQRYLLPTRQLYRTGHNTFLSYICFEWSLDTKLVFLSSLNCTLGNVATLPTYKL
jgi:hypothetical protein